MQMQHSAWLIAGGSINKLIPLFLGGSNLLVLDPFVHPSKQSPGSPDLKIWTRIGHKILSCGLD